MKIIDKLLAMTYEQKADVFDCMLLGRVECKKCVLYARECLEISCKLATTTSIAQSKGYITIDFDTDFAEESK